MLPGWLRTLILLSGLSILALSAQLRIAQPSKTGDGGPAVNAEIDGPRSIAVDGLDNLYVYQASEEWKGMTQVIDVLGSIRRIDSSRHTISTIAEGCNPPVQERPPAGCITPISQIRFLPTGKLILAEFTYNRVRGFDPVTRRFSLIAGNGSLAFDGDGGPAIQAGMIDPEGITVDHAGNIFIGSRGYIRRVDAKTGIVSTLAGTGGLGSAGDRGPALAAQVGLPFHLAVDTSGNVYFANSRTYRIQKIDAGTGTIETIAGNDENKFSGDGGPAKAASIGLVHDLAVDPLGNVLFAIFGRVCRIERNTGVMTTVAGSGENGFSGDGGVATQARTEPDAIAVDSEGNLFIAEYLNARIRRVDAKTGVITTFAGNGLPRRNPAPGM
jgi:hypothetical protein